MTGGLSNLDCRNSECSAPFNFRQGRLFRFYSNHPKGNATSVKQDILKHLWLCEQCSEIYTLEYPEGTALLIPLAAPRLFSAVAYSEASPLGEEMPLHPVGGKNPRSGPLERWNETRESEAIDELLTRCQIPGEGLSMIKEEVV